MMKKACLLFAAVMLVVSGVHARGDEAARKPVPINVAESIIEPFWDPFISGLSKWRIDDGRAHGLEIKPTWASVGFQWASKPAQGPALRMSRMFGIDCAGYDRLLLAMTAPEGALVKIIAATNRGERSCVTAPADQKAAEYELDLAGAARLESLTIEIVPGRDGAAAGWFKWIGLQNTALLPQLAVEHDLSDMQWDTQLQTPDFEPSYKPRYGIFISTDELADMRARHEKAVAATGTSPLLQRAESLRNLQPEKGIHEFVNCGGRTNDPHARIRDAAMASIGDGDGAAQAGLVLRDKALLRMAARCALSLAASEKWDEDFMERFPGSAWELRSFRRGYVCTDIARIMDLAGEMFTEAGRVYLLRRLAEEGIGPMNHIVWRFDYIQQSNQMTFFGRGRLFAYLVMEREWPRVKPYTDLAVGDLRSLFDNLILPDGGFMEPPTYAIGTVRGGYRMFENVARARGQSISDVTPERIKRTGAYSAAVASTLPGSDVITVGDSGDTLGLEPLVLLSSLAPKSSWLALLRKRLTPEKTDALPYDLRHMVDALPAKTPPMPPFVLLPETGLAASTRMFGDEFIKVFVRGNGGGTFHDHEHEDTGSFVIEFAGEAFAMDPGIVEYDDPSHELLKHCERHNMLVPVVDGARPRPVEKIVKPVTPHGKGGKKAFNVELDITPAWAPHYKHWARRIDSRAPDELMIRDEYELAQGGGVDFFWQTALPCHVEGGTVVIQGKKGRATLTAGAGCSVRIQELPKVGETAQRRIAFRKEGIRGTVEVGVHFGTN